MKEEVQKILKEYLARFPEEKQRQKRLQDFLQQSLPEEITDWNNANGHLTAGAFVYCKSEDKFLMLYHQDLKMFLYPGGHVDKTDKSLLETAKRELQEETGLTNLELLQMCQSGIPFDIDTHCIPANTRIAMLAHNHFDFRYFFFTETIEEIYLDKSEVSGYQWMTTEEVKQDKNFGNVMDKLARIRR